MLAWKLSTILAVISSAGLVLGAVNKTVVCHCENDGCPPGQATDCTAPINGKCYVSLKEERDAISNELVEVHSAGCFDESAFFQCKGSLLNTKNFLSSKTFLRLSTECCDDEDYCNLNLIVQLPDTPDATESPHGKPFDLSMILSIVFGLAFGVAVIGLTLTYGCCHCRKRRMKDALQKQRMENQTLLRDPFSFPKTDGDVEKGRVVEVDMTSGSGSGLPQLVQTTIAKQLQFVRNVGKGRYGEVWHARYRGADVAVKIFLTLEEASWEAERDLYGTVMLRDENLLGFIAADIGGTGACTQMLLITAYHPSSLYDFLRRLEEPLDDKTVIHMAEGLASGLSHLHAEIVGTAAKPSIVHRDIKSKNILVKNDGISCVVGDFGLALREDNFKEIPSNKDMRQGTKRYMAPEILDDTVQRNSFEALRMADMYALGLVYWELVRCTGDAATFKNEYELPYYDMVGSDPGFDEIRQVVSEWKLRPKIEPTWTMNEPKRSYVKIMQECWSIVPSARITALRAKKSLGRLQAGSS